MSQQEGGERESPEMLPSKPGKAVLLMNRKLTAALVAYTRRAQYQTCKNSIMSEGEARESPSLVGSLWQWMAAEGVSVFFGEVATVRLPMLLCMAAPTSHPFIYELR